ncbi:non-ribosomal peptide synthetase [Chitinophaga pinensis]|uniref:Amino acid adenylation domain protein n=1 Tax=Chitinophaga pinensis (strain ATCC 43595 / DSM 2588 / LMG 13176 / NBRC 15968 / NCIMB 11800 / UQM 2034) TaxID=485918 RepID=A0A979G517_CHIPD|nr:non-ribosomal peptide synthetase [Chitinophaga pinensis]ACU60886.1 amino acid adenylation domain protein [Chitinophaga pinensis DSM 2588]
MSIAALMTALNDLKVELTLTGDDQLKIIAPQGSVGPKLIEQIREHKEALIRSLKAGKDAAKIRRIPAAPLYEVSHAQRRLWILQQLDESRCAYNICVGYELNGVLDKSSLKKAFQMLVARHEILRTVFVNDAGGLWQKVLGTDVAGFNIIEVSLEGKEAVAQQQDIEILAEQLWKHAFDLAQGPLLRVQLVTLGEKRHMLMMGMHHIISDAWSLEIMMNDLVTLYGIAATDEQAPEELAIQYRDFSYWQNRLFESPRMKAHERYWNEQMSGEIPLLDMATDYPRPARKSYAGYTKTIWLDAATTKAFRDMLRTQQGASMFMALTACVNALLFRYTGQEDIILGTPVAGRSTEELSGQIGCYVNTLALRTRFNGDEGFNKLLDKVKEVLLNAYEHEVYPFDKLVEDLGLVTEPSRSALFDVLISYRKIDIPLGVDHTTSEEGNNEAELQVNEFVAGERESSKFDLTFNFEEHSDAIWLGINYSTVLFSSQRIDQMLLHMQGVIKAVSNNARQTLSGIAFLQEEQRHLLLSNGHIAPATTEAETLQQLFELQVTRTPEHIALVAEGRSLSYRALNQQADCIAAGLIRQLSVKPGDIVAIRMDRTPAAIAALLGILKAGAAYLPIDTDYPEERISYMLADSNARIVLTEELCATLIAANETCNATNGTASAHDLAYVIYTSGSTGAPKGVMIEHHAVLNLLAGLRSEMQLRTDWQYLLTASLSFDAAVKQIFIPLTAGATLHLSKDTADVTSLVKYIRQQHINVMHAMPMLWKAILAEIANTGDAPSLCCLSSGGDELDKECMEEMKRRFPQAAIYNTYGPTEICVNALIYDLQQPGAQAPLLGKCLPGYRAYIVDRRGNLMPEGYPGELCIAGTGLARGYLGREQLTQERFVADPYNRGALMYLTGDLVRRAWDGNIEFLGRNDHQVKIRGYRIEIGEVERTVAQYEGVKEAVVAAWQSPAAEKELVCYTVWTATPDEAGLRTHLQQFLPRYMHPAYYVTLDALPLNGNGKVVRKQLPAPVLEVTSSRYEAPRNETEVRLVTIWEESLQRKGIGIHDNFFELGGHSLKGMRMLWRIRQEFGVDIPFRELFLQATISKLSTWLQPENITAPVSNDAPVPVPIADKYPLSHAQQRLWILDKLEESVTAYNIFTGYELKGSLDIKALDTAFLQLLQRHEILRTVFRSDEEGPWQYVLSPEESGFEMGYTDLSAKGIIAQQQQLALITGEEKEYRFALDLGPLIRVQVIRLSVIQHVLLLNMHHIITDGWSQEVLLQDLVTLYAAAVQQTPADLPALPIQYKDYATWQRKQLAGIFAEKHAGYWREHLRHLPVLELPEDYTRPPLKTFNGATLQTWLDGDDYKALQACLHQRTGISMFMLLIAALKALCYRYTGQEDIVLGTPVAGRDDASLAGQIGFFVNTLVLRTAFDGNDTFNNLLEKVQQTLLDAYEHQFYPFDKLLEDLRITPDRSRSALFDVMVAYATAGGGADGQTPDELQVMEYETGEVNMSKFDLTVHFTDYTDQLAISINYNTDLFSAARITAMLGHFSRLLQAVTHNPELPLSVIPYLSESEEQQLLTSFNNTAAVYNRQTTIHKLFEEQVSRNGEAAAVTFGESTLTYAALNTLAEKVALTLQQQFNVTNGSFVGVMMDRSDRLIVSLLGILKAGAAYIPVDPSYPAERIRYMLEDSKPVVLVSDNPLATHVAGQTTLVTYQQLISHEHNDSTVCGLFPAAANDLAYVIYTSGSTGRPKGVMVEHRSVINLCNWHQQSFGLDGNSRSTVYAGVAFDALGWEIWPYLLSGGCIYPVNAEYRTDANLLQSFIDRNNITHAFVPTALYEELGGRLSHRQDNNLQLLVGGDRLNKVYPGATVINNYGPTESTVVATSAVCTTAAGRITIGKPVSNTRIYILDGNLELKPVGYAGELCIAGEGLARGYLGREELTNEKFIDNPFEPGNRMYKTGDLARWTSDGNIEFLGRNDHQVKIRGFRIETGEIEQLIQQHPAVAEVLVTTWEPSPVEKELVAYIVWKEKADEQDLRKSLDLQLPRYMHPSVYVTLDRMPLTGNGKVDRRQLPVPQLEVKNTCYEGAASDAQQQLINIWESILQRTGIGIHDNFFDLGGHSLKGMRMLWKIHQEFGVDIPFHELFSRPTISDLSERLFGTQQHTSLVLEPVAVQDRYELSHAQRRLWILDLLEESAGAYNIVSDHVLYGEINRSLLEAAFKGLIDRHEILRTIFSSDEEGEWQQVLPADQFTSNMQYTDLTDYDEEMQDRLLDDIRDAERHFRFNLGKGPLFRIQVIQRSNNQYHILLNLHHIIADGWSMEVLRSELEQLYAGKELTPLPVQYRDYAAWHNKQLDIDETHGSYWKSQLTDSIPILELPADYTRPAIKTYNGAIEGAWLNKETCSRLQTCLQNTSGTNIFMLLVAGLKALFHRYTRQEDIVLGTVVAGRDHEYLSGQIGFYVNTLVLRTRFTADNTFGELLQQVQQVMVDAYTHQAYPFDKLVEDLDLAADRSRSPLFDVMASYTRRTDAVAGEENKSADQSFKMTGSGTARTIISKFDMTVHFAEHENGIEMSVVYNTDIFTKKRIKRMLAHLQELFAALSNNIAIRLSAITYTTAEERNTLDLFSYKGETPYPATQTLHALFEQQAQRKVDSPAVIYEKETLSYAELNRASDQVACYLRQAYHVKNGDLVGLMMTRSARLMVCLLGILKAGAAYVPIDPEYPADRIQYMLEDSQPAVLITDTEVPDALNDGVEVMHVNAEWELLSYYHDTIKLPADSQSLAYIIYTSGSTGRPKGAMIPHHAVVNLCTWLQESIYAAHGGELTAMLTASVNFDASVQQLFAPLLSGAKLVIISETDRRNAESYIRQLKEQQVAVIDITPGYLRVLLEVLKETGTTDLNVQYVLVGGEALPAEERALFHQVFQGKAQLINVYGVTEATVDSTYEIVEADDDNSLSIGRPLKNTRIYILDKNYHTAGIGIPGELCIGGVGVGLGYLNREELTKERFIDNPYVAGERLYRTGDLARWAENGTIEYLGRSDNQVKIRGYRIETGEIENALLACPEIREAVVQVYKAPTGDKLLVSYIVWRDTVMEEALQEWLNNKLPRYMHPAYNITMAQLPLTANGKVDRKKLPDPDITATTVYEAPRTPVEIALTAIWEEVLQRSPIGIHDSFFALGGHSLKAIRLMVKVAKTFDRRASIRELYEYPDIASLAAFLERPEDAAETLVFPLNSCQETETPPLIFIPPVIGSATIYRQLAAQLDKQYACYGMQYKGFGGGAFATSIEDMAATFVQQLQDKVPSEEYLLMGYSMGGLIAYETTRQLEAAGKTVTLLLLDKEAPVLTSGIKILPAGEVLEQRFTNELRSWGLNAGELPQEDHLKKMYQSSVSMMHAYQPAGPVKADIIAFEADSRETSLMDCWQQFTTGSFDHHRLQGDHYSVIKDSRLAAYLFQLGYSRTIIH